jgi:exo-beta-1,3-glucanase (GH17 family)/cellulose synthase/poly-beta-1,6-N-acetylglucosamine synthase-like glycosyltransferase
MPRRVIRRLPILFVLLALSAITLGVWAIANRPMVEPPWPAKVAGYAYSPYRAGQSPLEDIHPSPDEIRADLALLATQTDRIRTYSATGAPGDVPALAAEFGIKVTAGAWLSADPVQNVIEVTRLVELVNANPNIDRVIVGNEVLLREEMSVDDLLQYVRFVRGQVRVPVSTAEPWHLWTEHRVLARECDFIAAHFLPYWQGKSLEDANDHIASIHYAITQAFPGKPVLLAEVGWPSRGREVGEAEATIADEARFLRNFLPMAADLKLDYFLMEAFDQPWKQANEGSVGAYWGVWDADRQQKFPFTRPIVETPEWKWLVAVSIALALLTFLLLLTDGSLLRKRALAFLAAVAFASTTTLVWMANEYFDQYATLGTVLLGIVLAVSALGVMLVLLVEAHEWAEAVWARRRREFAPVLQAEGAWRPKVSIHVPCYNEPPDMVMATLDALAALQWADCEVLVIDNNTKDPAVWEPVQLHCSRLNARLGGERFRFFHVAPLAGFKAGALNFALRHTDPRAEVVAVIDSDYQVDADWLAHLVPHFARGEIAIVQAPQDYRDGDENAFKRMCHAEYKGFFHIGMVTRNDRNAIIQHGTMTMVRRRVLEEVGGWAEWCITEDAELGLRIFAAGHEAAYVERSYGKGLIPDNCVDWQKQRFRWAFGAMQILRTHARALFLGRDTALTPGQRYHFVGGWLPWLADGFNLVFTLGALLWSLGMILWPQRVDPPLAVFAMPPLMLFFFKWAKLWFLYRRRVGTGRATTFAAAFAGLALSWTIGRAVLYGLLRKSMPFLRTPKLKDRESLWSALLLSREELALCLVLLACAVGVALRQNAGATDVQLWVAVLLVQAVPLAAAVAMGVVSARGRPGNPG